ncbi:hypothetical protein HK098_004623 [Nowakowskiella sp. JEL0407]|nr:hypothetical protein HK098_004623 [Nowakowskiella sp. JEL0407]
MYFDIRNVTAANVNQANANGYLPIHLAATNNVSVQKRVQDVTDLLNLGASVEIPDFSGRLPSQIAWDFGSREAYRTILAHAKKCDILPRIRSRLQLSEIHLAVIFKDLERFKELLETLGPGDINACDISNATPLHHAASIGLTEFVQLLLDNGAKVDAQDTSGRTPLYITAGEGRLEAAKLLMSRNADIYKNRDDGCTLIGCASTNGHATVLRLVIDKMVADGKYDPDSTQCSCGVNALHHAPNAGVVNVLVDTGSDVNFIRNGRTPLVEATDQQRIDVVEALLKNGADPNVVGDSRWSALHCAIRCVSYPLIKMLLYHRAKVSYTKPNSLTIAVECFTFESFGYKHTDLPETIELLLSFNAVPDASTFSALLRRNVCDLTELFIELFQVARNQTKSLAWESAVMNYEERLCFEILKIYVGFRAGWMESNDEVSNGFFQKWKPRKPVEDVERRVWNKHHRVIFRWIVYVKEEMFALIPTEVLMLIEFWL